MRYHTAYSEKCSRQLRTLVLIMAIFLVSQCGYSIIEFIRHWYVDGFDSHTGTHLVWGMMCAWGLIEWRQAIYEVVFFKWDERP